MNKNKSRSVALNGILIALMIAMTCTMLATGGMAFFPLIVLVVGSVIAGKWTALILGLTFGLISFASAFVFPSLNAPLFQNPLVSVLPRVLIGVVMYGVYWLSELCFKKINSKRSKPLNAYATKCTSTALGAIFGVLFNTFFVLLMILVLYYGKNVGDRIINKEVILGFITINFAVEIIVTPLLSAPIVFAVDKFLKKNQKQVVTEADLIDYEMQQENEKNVICDNNVSVNERDNLDNICNNYEIKKDNNLDSIENNANKSDNNFASVSSVVENDKTNNLDDVSNNVESDKVNNFSSVSNNVESDKANNLDNNFIDNSSNNN